MSATEKSVHNGEVRPQDDALARLRAQAVDLLAADALALRGAADRGHRPRLQEVRAPFRPGPLDVEREAGAAFRI
jgi:hypothetical protein